MRVLRKKLPPDVLYIGPRRVRFGAAAVELLQLTAYKSCDIYLLDDGFEVKFRKDKDGMRALNFGKVRNSIWCDIFLRTVIKNEGWPTGHFYFRVLQPDTIRVSLKEPALGLAPVKKQEVNV